MLLSLSQKPRTNKTKHTAGYGGMLGFVLWGKFYHFIPFSKVEAYMVEGVNGSFPAESNRFL